MYTSLLRFLRPRVSQLHFHSLRAPAALPLSQEEVILEAICVNLRHRKWGFLQQFSPLLTDLLVRRVILRSRASPHLALDFFCWAEQQKQQNKNKNQPPSLCLETHSIVLHVLISAKLFDEALSLMKHLMREMDIHVLDLLNSLARTHASCDASPAVYDAMIRACTQIGAVEDAYVVIERLRVKGFLVSIHAWNNFLNHVLMLSSDGSRFWKLYKKMLSFGYVENVNTFNLLIYALCREGSLWEAFSVLYRMLKRGVLLNVVTFNMLIDGCCRNGEVDLALKLTEKIRFVSGMATEPNFITYNCLINGLCKIGKVVVAKQLLRKDMLREGIEPNVKTYATLIDGYAREGNMAEALKLFDEIFKKNMMPNVVVYNSLINWFFKQGYVEEAFFLLSDMKENHIALDHFTYSILLDTCYR